ncbi:MAG: Ppx/GppA family phosphatase [Bdellovibrionaceae bacterium]|nr:Ppx/GppA family phosphatase [Pseudobdellovibrionaceae bacterium]
MKPDDCKIASIDIGSNSFLLLLCRASSAGIVQIDHDVVDIVRLGQGLSGSNRFHPDALKRADKTLSEFKKLIDQYKPDVVLAKATAAARRAENRAELVNIGKKFGIDIQTIPGEYEAKITYQGVFWGQSEDTSDYNMLIDIGGGSTELIVGKGLSIEYSISIPFGAVLLTERFITTHPILPDDEANLVREIESEIALALKNISKFPIKNIYAVAGTPTTLAQILLGGYEDAKVNGFVLTLDHLKKLETELKIRTPEQRIREMGVPKGRADVLYAGTVLLRKLVDALAGRDIFVSTRGVRHGIVADYFLNQSKAAN